MTARRMSRQEGQLRGKGKKAGRPDLQVLPAIFSKYPDVQAVYLFGSAAAGKARQESDLDLAVFPDSPSLRGQKLQILSDLAAQGFCHVDLVFLAEDDIVLQYEAVRLNVVVYHRPDFDRGYLYSKIVRKYLDFLPYLAVQRAAYKKRILGGQV